MAYASEFRYKNSRHRRGGQTSRRKAFVFASLLLAAVVFVTVFLQKNVSGVLYNAGEAFVRAAAESALNDAVAETLAGAGYASFVTVQRDGEGRVLSIEANAADINLFARMTASAAMAKIAERAAAGIRVPVGAFTGIGFLAGAGPSVTFRILSAGSVACSFRSEFTGAGINQSLHSVYLGLEATVGIVMPSGTDEIVARAEVLAAESVIVGEVPEIFFGADLFGDGYRVGG